MSYRSRHLTSISYSGILATSCKMPIVNGSTNTEEVKTVTSICALLNARSTRVKGIQLLINMMLIARLTSKHISLNNIIVQLKGVI